MPVPSSIVGRSTEAMTKSVDARWLMAYAAGIGDTATDFLDTRRAEGIVGHPLFPVCVEWDLVLAARGLVPPEVLTRDELVRGVHATHDLRIHRLVVPGDVLRTTATVVGVERRRPGAYETLRLDSVDAHGSPVATTLMGSLFLGVDVDGPDRPFGDPDPRDPVAPSSPALHTRTRPIAATAAHVYTECSRIWNPIHTDPAVAAAAGLPGLILHGTATLAMAVTGVMAACDVADPSRVSRIRCRFGAMVSMPSTIAVNVLAVDEERAADGVITVHFDVRTADGEVVISGGRVVIDQPT